MNIILLEHVRRLGQVGEVVTVKDGYGRNYLIPQGKAMRATKANIKDIESRRAALQQQNEAKRETALKEAGTLEGLSVKLVRQASEAGKLYGSVTVRDVADALAEKGYDFPRQTINLGGAVKSLGLYHATITLHSDVIVSCDIEVVRSKDATAYDTTQWQQAASS